MRSTRNKVEVDKRNTLLALTGLDILFAYSLFAFFLLYFLFVIPFLSLIGQFSIIYWYKNKKKLTIEDFFDANAFGFSHLLFLIIFSFILGISVISTYLPSHGFEKFLSLLLINLVLIFFGILSIKQLQNLTREKNWKILVAFVLLRILNFALTIFLLFNSPFLLILITPFSFLSWWLII